MRALHYTALAALFAVIFSPTRALAAPGVGAEVYGATIAKGELEIEARYGRLTGGANDGEDGVTFELAYAPSSRFRFAVLAEFERDAGAPRKAHALAVEAIATFGRVGGIDVAGYAEYAVGFNGRPDSVEAKLLLERRAGRFDARVNLIAEKPLVSGAPVELGYAASADFAVAGDFRVGAAAFGELGTFNRFAPRSEHFLGPVVKTEIEHFAGHELKIQAGYLFALDKARQDTKGQIRLLLEMEF